MKTKSKSLLAVIILVLSPICISAQLNDEAEIRNLEKMEAEAFVKKDTIALYRLLSQELVVNTPLNKVTTFKETMNLFRNGMIDMYSIEKEIEKITFIQNIAVVMGKDTVKPQGKMPNAGKTVTRRYTDVWMKDKTGWKLTVRQATIVSVN